MFNLVITLVLEHVYSIKLYMIDLDGWPSFNLTSIVLSIPLFYILKGFSYAKLKIQGHPCDKILEEITEYFENEKNRGETVPMVKDLEMQSDIVKKSTANTMMKKDLSAIKEMSVSSPYKNNGTD